MGYSTEASHPPISRFRLNESHSLSRLNPQSSQLNVGSDQVRDSLMAFFIGAKTVEFAATKDIEVPQLLDKQKLGFHCEP